MNKYRIAIEDALNEYLDKSCDKNLLGEAMRYAVLNGGKRARPTLMLIFSELYGVEIKKILPLAVALEFIHSYSLVHDDLPGMDNDMLRRGLPTVHAKYGEGMGVLVGDALLNTAHEIMLETAINSPELLLASAYISKIAGVNGMVGGQAIDITVEKFTEKQILNMYAKKTGALIRASVVVPAIVANKDIETAEEIGSLIGLIFQLVDDKLDYESGEDRDKPTYVNLFGAVKNDKLIIKSQEKLDKLLAQYGAEGNDAVSYARFLTKRRI